MSRKVTCHQTELSLTNPSDIHVKLLFKRPQTEWKLTQTRHASYVLQECKTWPPSGATRSHNVRLLNDALSTAFIIQHRIKYFFFKNKLKQDRQCTLTPRRVREAISIMYSENCVYRFRYPACNAHAPYCHPWPLRLHSVFPHYLINGTIFEEKLLNIKCVF